MTHSSHEQKQSVPREDLSPLVRTVLAGNPARSYRVGLAVGIVLAVSTALLVIQNGQSARLTWLAWHFSAPLWLILLLAVVAGALLLPLCVLLWTRSRAHRADRKAAGEHLRRLAEQAPPGGTDPARTSAPPSGADNHTTTT